jgi:hypothetical protein
MAKTFDQLRTDINAAFPDVGPSRITPADLRGRMVDFVDSVNKFTECVAYPLNQAGIDDAYSKVLANGGGVIRLLAGEYVNISSMPISSGISYIGVVPSWTGAQDFPEQGGIPTGGTQISCVAGSTVLKYNHTDKATPDVNFAENGLYGCKVYGVTFKNAGMAIKIGAKNSSGCYFCTFDEIYYVNCTNEWAVSFENFQYSLFGTIVGRSILPESAGSTGGLQFGQSVDNSVVLTGDSQWFGRVFVSTSSRNGRGVRFFARNNGQLNDLSGSGATWQVNIYGASAVDVPITTVGSGSPDILVTNLVNWDLIQVGKPLVFSEAPQWLDVDVIYWIVSVNVPAKTFRVSEKQAGIAKNIDGVLSPTIKIGSFPSFEFIGEDTSLITKGVTAGINCENTAAICTVSLLRARWFEIDFRLGGLFPSIAGDISANDSTGVATFNILYNGGALKLYNYNSNDFRYRATSPIGRKETANTTLSSIDHTTTLTIDSATPTSVTVPRGLPVGFKCEVMQKGTGAVTILSESGITLVSLANKVKTAGNGAVVSVTWSDKTAWKVRSGDDSTYSISGDLIA